MFALSRNLRLAWQDIGFEGPLLGGAPVEIGKGNLIAVKY
jgi:hypothetical protein